MIKNRIYVRELIPIEHVAGRDTQMGTQSWDCLDLCFCGFAHGNANTSNYYRFVFVAAVIHVVRVNFDVVVRLTTIVLSYAHQKWLWMRIY